MVFGLLWLKFLKLYYFFLKYYVQKKLEEYKLDITPKTIYAKYKLNNYKDKGNSSHLSFDVYSFNPSKTFNPSGPVEINLPGNLVILNTIEEFKGFNTEKALGFY